MEAVKAPFGLMAREVGRKSRGDSASQKCILSAGESDELEEAGFLKDSYR